MLYGRWLRRFGLLLSAIACLGTAQPESGERIERVEWTWAEKPSAVDPELPNVLLIGDSIARDYFPGVGAELQGRANVYLFATSATVGDPRLLAQLAGYSEMMRLRFQVIHFNNGMHGWRYGDDAYARAFPAFVRTVRRMSPKARLVWATTTPVIDAPGRPERNARISVRNAAARAALAHANVALDDLNALMSGRTDLYRDTIHFSAEGSALQARATARSIEAALGDTLEP